MYVYKYNNIYIYKYIIAPSLGRNRADDLGPRLCRLPNSNIYVVVQPRGSADHNILWMDVVFRNMQKVQDYIVFFWNLVIQSIWVYLVRLRYFTH